MGPYLKGADAQEDLYQPQGKDPTHGGASWGGEDGLGGGGEDFDGDMGGDSGGDGEALSWRIRQAGGELRSAGRTWGSGTRGWGARQSTGGAAAFDRSRYRFATSPVRNPVRKAGEPERERAPSQEVGGRRRGRVGRLRTAWGQGGGLGKEDAGCFSSRGAAMSSECQERAVEGGGSTLHSRREGVPEDPCDGTMKLSLECVRRARQASQGKFDRTTVNCGGLSSGEIAVGVLVRAGPRPFRHARSAGRGGGGMQGGLRLP